MYIRFWPYGSEKNPRIDLLVSEYQSNLMINTDKVSRIGQSNTKTGVAALT
jgi:hypothetical protein